MIGGFERDSGRNLRVAILLTCGLFGACPKPHDPAPTVGTAEPIRGAFTVTRGETIAVREPVRVERGANVQAGSDGRGAVRLDSGAWILLDRNTDAAVELAKVKLTRGRIFIDTTRADETTVETPHGVLRASSAGFSVAIGQDHTAVYVGSGEVTYQSDKGSDRVAQGETLKLSASAPVVQPEALWDDWTGGLADPAPNFIGASTPVGALLGREVDKLGIARTPLPVRGHNVQVTFRGDLARTEVTQQFFNARSESLEAEWRIRLPEGAIVESFAVDLGGGFVLANVGAFSSSGAIELAWADPQAHTSALAYDGPNHYRARLFPIAPGATVQIKFAYTEWLPRREGVRTYTYPMEPEGAPQTLGEFTIEVDTRGAHVGAMRAGMGAVVEDAKVFLRRSDFSPRADFSLDLFDQEPVSADAARAYVVRAPAENPAENTAEGEERYVLFDIPTERDDEDEPPPLDLVLLVDTSGAVEPESLELSRAVVETVLRQLAPTDRVTLRLSDLHAHVPADSPAALSPANQETREKILAGLSTASLGGATDLGRALSEASAIVAGKKRGAVLYLGDGLPTSGSIDATSLRADLAALEHPPRFFAIGIGDGANQGLLRATFGPDVPVVRERVEAGKTVMRLLAEAARPTLRGVRVDAGPTIERMFPQPGMTLPIGASLRLVGRLRGDLPTTIALHATKDGAPFEKTYAVAQNTLDDFGEVRKRWAQARLSELLDADAGREALVDLGVRFSIATPWTSWIVGGAPRAPFRPVRGWDRDPDDVAWSIGGSAPAIEDTHGIELSGWRRRTRRAAPSPNLDPETTWTERDREVPTVFASASDGGLAQAALTRALHIQQRGPRACYERKLLTRPDLDGTVRVAIEVDPNGAARQTTVVSSGTTLEDEDVRSCILTEVNGIRFPSGNASQHIEYTYVFDMPTREIGVRRRCSDASEQALDIRRALWRERLAANTGVQGALTVWREALAACELRSWTDKRALLAQMLAHVGSVRPQIALYRAFQTDASIATYLRRAILRNVRTPDDALAIREGLDLVLPLDWDVFSSEWRATSDPEVRLRLVRHWLEVVPEEMDLRLKLLSLLEQTRAIPEARRLARALRADPLADRRVRTAVGEFWLRQHDETEARRAFSEMVEFAPLDPWARERLGDLYRAHGWPDDAYREYQRLARLRPGDDGVLLRIARAAADAGRIDEALRLEQRLSESADENEDSAARFARLWSQVRLARLLAAAPNDAAKKPIFDRRRTTGALRNPPAIFIALTWDHPDDRPELFFRQPSTPIDPSDTQPGWERAPRIGTDHGIEGIRVMEREEGEYQFEVRRSDRDGIRDVRTQLLIVIAPGTPNEKIVIQPVVLTKDARTVRYRLDPTDVLSTVATPR